MASTPQPHRFDGGCVVQGKGFRLTMGQVGLVSGRNGEEDSDQSMSAGRYGLVR